MTRRAEDHERWRRERDAARAHARVVRRGLDDAIAVGDRRYRRLRHRLDDYGTHLDAVESGLRHAGYLTD
jgi:hypothetical protein